MATRTASALIPIGRAIDEAAERLRAVAENPRLEARLLLAHVLQQTAADLIRDPTVLINPTRFTALVDRRLAHEPIAYLIGRREFWSLDLRVSAATLIPRPDSETIVEAALRLSPSPERVLDLGTGSGCLLLAILHERPRAFGIGTDRSAGALTIARENAARCGVRHRTGFVLTDWTIAIDGRFDLIVSNPPYIPQRGFAALMPEVAVYEPRSALDGGVDGLAAYRRIIPDLERLLSNTGLAVLEVGVGQADDVAELGRESGLGATIQADLAGIVRAVILACPAG